MASIRKRTLPSGKTVWQADYTDAMGTRRHKQFPTKRDADAFMVNARSEVTTGIHVPDSASTTVSKAANDWLKAVEQDEDLERSTYEHYRQHVEIHIRPLIGSKKLTQVTTPIVYAFVDAMKAKGRSKETVRRAVQSLGRIFKFAKGRGLVGQNPVADVRLASSKRGKKRPEMPTREELKTLLNTVSGRWRPLIITATFTGLRASELRGLRWDDVDLKKAVLTVRQRADAWLEIGKPKTENSQRDVPLAPIVVNTLREWKLACPIGDLGLVFPSGAGNVEHHPNIVKRGWNPLQVKCGITEPMKDRKGEIKRDKDGNVVMTGKYNFHCLRHAAAALFIEQGMRPDRVQAVMGHSSIQVTYDVYGYLFADEDGDQKAVREIEARLLG
jgi:integrase